MGIKVLPAHMASTGVDEERHLIIAGQGWILRCPSLIWPSLISPQWGGGRDTSLLPDEDGNLGSLLCCVVRPVVFTSGVLLE